MVSRTVVPVSYLHVSSQETPSPGHAVASLQSSAGPSPTVSTYQTRIAVYTGRDRADGDAGLSAYAELYGKVQRKLFADVAAGRSAASLKNAYLEHGIPGRMFNGVWVSLDGKVSAVRESQRLRQDSLRRRLDRAERQVAVAAEQGRWQRVHQKRRRLANLQSKLAVLEADIAAGRVRLCFGSKKLWRKRHHLETNTVTRAMRSGCRTGKMLATVAMGHRHAARDGSHAGGLG